MKTHLLLPSLLLATSALAAQAPAAELRRTTPTRKFENVPLYILTSGKSFSAGEAFPFIPQQYGRATIVGETTPGGDRCGAGGEGCGRRRARRGAQARAPEARQVALR